MRKTKMAFIHFLSVILILNCLLGSAYAVSSPSDVDHVDIVRKTSIQTYSYQGNSFGNLNGMTIGRADGNLYAIKSNDDTTLDAMFFYYPNYPSSTRARLLLKNVGHANGMAVDNNYVYVTGITLKVNGVAQSTLNILRIPRSLIASKAQEKWNLESNNDKTTQVIIEEDNPSTPAIDGYKYLVPKVANTDPGTQSSQPYVNYDRIINNMACYDNNGAIVNGHFIINYQNDASGFPNRRAFTRAKVKTYNNEEFLYISESTQKVFILNYTFSDTNMANADICYSSKCGFFVPKFYKTPDTNGKKTKNEIIWANIDQTTNNTITYGAKTYKLFPVTVFTVDPKNDTEYGVPIYQNFELEGMDFDASMNLYASANVSFTDAYKNAYFQANGKNPATDAIFRLIAKKSNNSTVSWKFISD